MWILGGLITWLVVAVVVAVVIGKGIRLADRRSSGAAALGAARASDDRRPVHRPAASRVRRRAVPVPTLGVVLFGIAVALEASGYVVRLTGATGQTSRLLSMDAPFSVPRMYVAALFAAAALAALAGAGSIPGRRTWWLAVGVVAGGIAAVKAGAVHSVALATITEALGTAGALALSALAAASVVGALWFLSRTERRDRRRILGVLALYAAASVGLSAVSAAAREAFGFTSTWAAAATFLEESAEALAGVAFLVGVLVGVAPRLVLPAAWALRRAADAHTLELPEALPGRPTANGIAGL
jgi:hypothetical protein